MTDDPIVRITAYASGSTKPFDIEVVTLPTSPIVGDDDYLTNVRYQTIDSHDVMRVAEGHFWIPHLKLDVFVDRR